MRYSNEFKVGFALVLSAIVFVLGVRYFEDIPLFRGTYQLYTELQSADGLIPGNEVRIRGVKVGTITDVGINPETNDVRVFFRLDEGMRVPEGSTTEVVGIDAIGVVRLDVNLGPPSNPPIEPGGYVPAEPSTDLLATLTDRAPALAGQLDTLLVGLNTTVGQANDLLQGPEAELRATLRAFRGTAATLDQVLRAEQARLSSVLANVDALTADLGTFTGTQGDSLALVVSNLNATLRRLDASLDGLDATTERLDSILAKIDEGQGTLGLMVNDPSLYQQLDSAATQFNTLMTDFQRNPQKYLRDLRLIDVF